MLRILPALLAAALLLTALPAAPRDAGEVPLGVAAVGELPDEVVIGFHGPIPSDVGAWLEAHGGRLLMQDDVLRWVSAKLPDAAGADRLLAAAQARGDVRYAHRDGTASILLVPNDPMYGSQWGYPAINAPAAWDVTLGSHAARVAVLDTGIQITHPDLRANACGPFASFVPTEPTIDDGHGHGTHVSGTVAAVTNNNVGVSGTGQSCLMGAKVLSRFGSGQWTWVAAGIRWAADNGAHVISMSLGGGNPGAVMEDAVKYAYNTKGVLVIAAAGNSGCPTLGLSTLRTYALGPGSIIWPAIYDEVQAVAALAPPDGLETAGFSSCGVDMEIAAPGQSVLSTYRNSGYTTFSGTSMAAPHVAGVAGLVKSQNPGIGALALRCLLDLSSTEAGLPGRDYQTGWGRLDALKALSMDAALTAAGAHASFAAACKAGEAAIMH